MAKKKIKKTWVSVAEIPQNTIYMMSLPIRFFMQEWPKIGLGDKIKEYFSLYEKDFCRMYYPRQEFDEQADFLATKMLSQPAWALRIIGRVERWSRLFMEQSKKIRRQPLKKLTNQQLIQLYKSGEKYQVLSQWHRGIGQLARGRGKGARDQGDLAGASGASAKKREQLEYGGYFQCPDHSA